MQFFYQDIDSIDFVGPIGDPYNFDRNKNYLGEWTRQNICDNIGEYANTMLLSVGENGTPLVIKECLIAGLGVVTQSIVHMNWMIVSHLLQLFRTIN